MRSKHAVMSREAVAEGEEEEEAEVKVDGVEKTLYCLYCPKPGHWAGDCRKRKADEERQRRENKGEDKSHPWDK